MIKHIFIQLIFSDVLIDFLNFWWFNKFANKYYTNIWSPLVNGMVWNSAYVCLMLPFPNTRFYKKLIFKEFLTPVINQGT